MILVTFCWRGTLSIKMMRSFGGKKSALSYYENLTGGEAAGKHSVKAYEMFEDAEPVLIWSYTMDKSRNK